MPHEYSATDHRTGLQVTVRGEFPDDPEERVRIARTSNLFTRLMSTILATESTAERRERFRAIETQLEMADALIRGDMDEVQSLIRETLRQMGVTEDQVREAQDQLFEQLRAAGHDFPDDVARMIFGDRDDDPATPLEDLPPEDR